MGEYRETDAAVSLSTNPVSNLELMSAQSKQMGEELFSQSSLQEGAPIIMIVFTARSI